MTRQTPATEPSANPMVGRPLSAFTLSKGAHFVSIKTCGHGAGESARGEPEQRGVLGVRHSRRSRRCHRLAASRRADRRLRLEIQVRIRSHSAPPRPVLGGETDRWVRCFGARWRTRQSGRPHEPSGAPRRGRFSKLAAARARRFRGESRVTAPCPAAAAAAQIPEGSKPRRPLIGLTSSRARPASRPNRAVRSDTSLAGDEPFDSSQPYRSAARLPTDRSEAAQPRLRRAARWLRLMAVRRRSAGSFGRSVARVLRSRPLLRGHLPAAHPLSPPPPPTHTQWSIHIFQTNGRLRAIITFPIARRPSRRPRRPIRVRPPPPRRRRRSFVIIFCLRIE